MRVGDPDRAPVIDECRMAVAAFDSRSGKLGQVVGDQFVAGHVDKREPARTGEFVLTVIVARVVMNDARGALAGLAATGITVGGPEPGCDVSIEVEEDAVGVGTINVLVQRQQVESPGGTGGRVELCRVGGQLGVDPESLRPLVEGHLPGLVFLCVSGCDRGHVIPDGRIQCSGDFGQPAFDLAERGVHVGAQLELENDRRRALDVSTGMLFDINVRVGVRQSADAAQPVQLLFLDLRDLRCHHVGDVGGFVGRHEPDCQPVHQIGDVVGFGVDGQTRCGGRGLAHLADIEGQCLGRFGGVAGLVGGLDGDSTRISGGVGLGRCQLCGEVDGGGRIVRCRNGVRFTEQFTCGFLAGTNSLKQLEMHRIRETNKTLVGDIDRDVGQLLFSQLITQRALGEDPVFGRQAEARGADPICHSVSEHRGGRVENDGRDLVGDGVVGLVDQGCGDCQRTI